ncbi:MAG: hypothetical protein L7T84_02705, partial [Akkermansiaceae bacterium]|nr:hypothetical protein [Akkermansiaceae bacterium]
PEAADGDGHSLVRISPASQLNPHDATSWRASTAVGGNAGTTDYTTFPGGDDAALLSYALGGSDVDLGVVLGTVVVPRNLAADDVIVTVQTSIDLINWTDLTEISDETLPAGGLSSQTYAVDPGGLKRFFRVGMKLR